MVKENINLRKIILHILDSSVGQPMLSDECLEYGSELSDFIKEHIGIFLVEMTAKSVSFISRNQKFTTYWKAMMMTILLK